MKAIIENRINCTILEKTEALVNLINDIQDCENEKELRERFSSENEYTVWYSAFFEIGFGSNHMWVKERVNRSVSDKRLILVEF